MCVCVCVCGVCVCVCVCLSVLLQRPLEPANNDTHGFILGFSLNNMCGVSKNPSVEKLWREKANMQMSWSFAHFRAKRRNCLKDVWLGRMLLQLAAGATGVKHARSG